MQEPIGDEATSSAASDSSAGSAASADQVESGAQSKERPSSLREFERALRGLGFTRSEAETVARGGWHALQGHATGDIEPTDELHAAILKLEAAIRSKR